MSAPFQRSKKSKVPVGSSTAPTGLLDAYVDEKTPESTQQDDGRPVSKKNKNKKKREQREAEEKRRQSESTSIPPEEEVDEVIDSWEDISAADAPALPKTAIKVEPAPKKVETPVKTEETKDMPSKGKNNHNKAPNKATVSNSKSKDVEKLTNNMSNLSVNNKKPNLPVSTEIIKTLETLQASLDAISHIFKNPPKITEAKPVQTNAVASEDEKAREAVKAEREAKKQAKAATKQAAKEKPNVPEEKEKNEKVKPSQEKVEEGNHTADAQAVNPDVDEKSRDEIKAEREAKKLAKAAAKKGVKVQTPAANVPKLDEEKQEVAQDNKSKADLKAERRAKQEAQRAAKELQKTQKPSKEATASQPEAPKPKPSTQLAPVQSQPAKSGSAKSQRVSDDIQADRPSIERKRERQLAAQQIPPRTKAQKKVLLFKHLHQFEREISVTRSYPIVGAHIHPSVLQLGLQYAEGTIQGSNARCVALLHTLRKVIEDYETPTEKDFSRDLDSKLKLYISYLKECRPHSVSMGNAIRTLKSKINSLNSSTDDFPTKIRFLLDVIDDYRNTIKLAPIAIYNSAVEKIKDGDVILTYGCSSLLRQVLIKAKTEGCRKFRVVIADGRPKLEGREMARHLVNGGIQCTYIHISSIPFIIKQVTKVLLGAHAVLANGFVMSRVGTAQLCLIAKAHNVPVMVCCETYKFSERVQTDSFVFNELGDPDDLVATGTKENPLEDWRDLKHLCLLNLTYDFTPANLIDAIISDISVIPCTSVPVVLRLKKDDLN